MNAGMAYETQQKHFILTKIRNLLTMRSCNDMQGDNTDNSVFTIPIGPDQEPALHPSQIQPEHFLSQLTSTFKTDAVFIGNTSKRHN
jgi:hypothetical protein